MKALCCLFLSITITASAGPIIRAEIGMTPDKEMYFTDMTVGYRFTLYGIESLSLAGMRTWAYYHPYWNGEPFEDIYYYEQRLTFRNFFLKFKHHCAHPVVTSKTNISSHQSPPDWWLGEITTVSAGFEYEIK